MKLRLIPAGEFVMGIEKYEEAPPHRVSITEPFYLGVCQVTQREWRAVMGGNPSRFTGCGHRCPVERVSWYEAAAYCNGLSWAHGLEPCYLDAGQEEYGPDDAAAHDEPRWPAGLACEGFRLPTEAEWEWAARAGTTGPTYASPDFAGGAGPDSCHLPVLHLVAWYCGNSSARYPEPRDCTGPDFTDQQFPEATCGTQPVGGKVPNPWGLHDVLGNVAEWVWDRQGAYGGAAVDPPGPEEGGTRGLRGGHYASRARALRSAARAAAEPAWATSGIGLRVARSVP